MKEITVKRRNNLKFRRKMVAIRESNEEKNCRTFVNKRFIYIVSKETEENPVKQKPQVTVRKSYNSQLKTEQFHFKIKGTFHVTRNRHLIRVQYCHILRIRIEWVNKDFSSKKLATSA